MAQQVSKNFNKGKLITDTSDIMKIAKEGGSVYVKNRDRLLPAAFLISWQFRLLYNWTKNEQFYKIEKR
jgi:hypothetical protein